MTLNSTLKSLRSCRTLQYKVIFKFFFLFDFLMFEILEIFAKQLSCDKRTWRDTTSKLFKRKKKEREERNERIFPLAVPTGNATILLSTSTVTTVERLTAKRKLKHNLWLKPFL